MCYTLLEESRTRQDSPLVELLKQAAVGTCPNEVLVAALQCVNPSPSKRLSARRALGRLAPLVAGGLFVDDHEGAARREATRERAAEERARAGGGASSLEETELVHAGASALGADEGSGRAVLGEGRVQRSLSSKRSEWREQTKAAVDVTA